MSPGRQPLARQARRPTAEPVREAGENCARRDHRICWPMTWKTKAPNRSMAGSLPPKGIGVEMRTVVDQLRKHGVGRTQKGKARTDLLCRAAMSALASLIPAGCATACPCHPGVALPILGQAVTEATSGLTAGP